MVSAFCRFYFFPFLYADIFINITPDVYVIGYSNFKVLTVTLLLFWISAFLVTIMFCGLTSSKT